jgi:hypothetical protein
MLSACTNLDTKISNQWSDKDTWTNAVMAQGMLMSVYKDVMTAPDAWDGSFLDAATDNALTRLYGSKAYRAGQGAFSRTSNPLDNWSNRYDQFQRIHTFLERGLTGDVLYDNVNTDNDRKIKQRLEGEAYFLRAWVGFQLLQMYGGKSDDGTVLGYPIVDRCIASDEAAHPENFQRDTYEDCVEQICNDCEKAFSLLPFVYEGGDAILGNELFGRASGSAAAALKVRTLLYAASPAYQSDNVVKLNGMGNYTVLDATAYKAKWERAALYAYEVLQMSGMGAYKALVPKELYDGGEAQSAEFLFRTFVGRQHAIEDRHYPPFYYGKAQTVPSQNLVDAFPAKNGFPITDARSLYDAQNPYVNRDNRLNVNVYYQGRKFGANNSYIDVAEGGKDSGYMSVDASRSGYYLAKFINTDVADFLKPLYQQDTRHYYPMLRKAEVWLNFAEAANEAWGAKVLGPGCTLTAYDVMKTVREKSGGITDVTYLDEVAATPESFAALIQNERRIEFAFENQRFWDLRRRLLPLDESIRGIKVSRNADGTESYTVQQIETRPLDDVRYYYLPLPYAEVQKNPNLKNNRGW